MTAMNALPHTSLPIGLILLCVVVVLVILATGPAAKRVWYGMGRRG